MPRVTHKWNEMSGPDVAELARETDVAVLPVGSTEMHGPHLPTGTDAFTAEGVAELVALQEPVIIMPPVCFNINDPMMCYPGTIAISPGLVSSLFGELSAEAARNGFRRVVLLIGHGGARAGYEFLQNTLHFRREEQRAGYRIFSVEFFGFASDLADQVLDSPRNARGHGGEAETSFIAHFRPSLVRLDRLEPLPEGEGPYHQKSVPGAHYVIDWVRQVPKGYEGQPHLATAAKGRRLAEAMADEVIKVVRDIKRYDFDRDI